MFHHLTTVIGDTPGWTDSTEVLMVLFLSLSHQHYDSSPPSTVILSCSLSLSFFFSLVKCCALCLLLLVLGSHMWYWELNPGHLTIIPAPSPMWYFSQPEFLKFLSGEAKFSSSLGTTHIHRAPELKFQLTGPWEQKEQSETRESPAERRGSFGSSYVVGSGELWGTRVQVTDWGSPTPYHILIIMILEGSSRITQSQNNSMRWEDAC